MENSVTASAGEVHKVAVALGANLGDATTTVTQALVVLDQIEETSLQACSSLYRSPAVGPGEQPDYINAAALVTTALAPLELLDALQAIENDFGRERSGERWGARTLDLDIVTYGEYEITEERLIVPHPEAHHRCFVLIPLAEIAPHLPLPGYGQVTALLAGCDTGAVAKIMAQARHG